MTPEEHTALVAEYRSLMPRMGFFSLLHSVLLGAITAEEMSAEMERREIVRKHPASILVASAASLILSGFALALGVLGFWALHGLALAAAGYVAWDVVRLGLELHRARRPEVTP